MAMSLHGRTITATGVASGIGRGTADRFIDKLVRVVSANIDGEGAAEAAGVAGRPEQVDLFDKASLVSPFWRLESNACWTNAVFANAGIQLFAQDALVSPITEDPIARAAIVGRIPLGRAGVAADTEGVMVYLASDVSAYATGGIFAIDGGISTL